MELQSFQYTSGSWTTLEATFMKHLTCFCRCSHHWVAWCHGGWGGLWCQYCGEGERLSVPHAHLAESQRGQTWGEGCHPVWPAHQQTGDSGQVHAADPAGQQARQCPLQPDCKQQPGHRHQGHQALRVRWDTLNMLSHPVVMKVNLKKL